MINVKLELNKSRKIVFKLKLPEEYKNNVLFKRAIMESKFIKGRVKYNYEVPLRFFFPIYNNYKRENINIDKKSILTYLEFSDFYDEQYYTELEATAKYMKKWREEGCPNIYKITIDSETHDIKKEIVFRKPSISFGKFKL